MPLTMHDYDLVRRLSFLPGSVPIALSERQRSGAAHRVIEPAWREVCCRLSQKLAGLSPSERAAQPPCGVWLRLKQLVLRVRKYEHASYFHLHLQARRLRNPTAAIVAVRGFVHREAAVIRGPDLP